MVLTEMMIRVALSIFVGGLIGYERQKTNRPAGFRTHILVCVGATVVSIIQVESVAMTVLQINENPMLANALKVDVGRMGAQVITGVGFLGAGTIIREKGVVKGLTTAASVWVVACIGLGIGLGLYDVTIVTTVGVFLVLVTLKRIEDKFLSPISHMALDLAYKDTSEKDVKKALEKYLNFHHVDVSKVEKIMMEDEPTRAIYYLEVPKSMDCTKMVHDLFMKKGIIKVDISDSVEALAMK